MQAVIFECHLRALKAIKACHEHAYQSGGPGNALLGDGEGFPSSPTVADMPIRKLGHLQRSILELAHKNEGRVWPDLVYRELFDHPARGGHGDRKAIDATTRNTVSRVLWSLEKRGLIEKSTDGKDFEVCNRPPL